MLKDEQAAELLIRCEKAAGKTLSQIRGNLQHAETRAAAVWERLVMDAAAAIGPIEDEPKFGNSHDILFHLPQGQPVWIEATFLHPRFWREERLSHEIVLWFCEEAGRRGIPPHKIHLRLDGDMNNEAGPVRVLPKQHEKKKFLNEPIILKFLDDVKSNPSNECICSLPNCSIGIHYLPAAQGPHITFGGLAQEVPKTIKEHSVYRLLRDKARQYCVNDPLIICIGSNQSRVISSSPASGHTTLNDAVNKAFEEYNLLSACYTISIRSGVFILNQYHELAAIANLFVIWRQIIL
jgi:hypothetical protein